MKNKLKLINAAALAVAMAGGTALAADVVWTGGGLDGMWGNSNSWDLGILPAAADGNWATIANGDTVTYTDGMTNNVQHHSVNGGSTFNFTGGFLNDNKSGNTRRTYIGTSGEGTLNVSGGKYSVGHLLRVGIGGTGTVNLDGGLLDIYRGGNSSFGGPSVSISMGNAAGNGTFNVTNGVLQTRVGVEMGENSLFHVYGTNSTITLGGASGHVSDGDWFQYSNAVFKVSITPDGITPIVLENNAESGSPIARFNFGSILDVSFVEGAMETNSWPLIVSEGIVDNQGMIFADGVDTNDWGFIVSNNTLFVGFGLGWPAGGDTIVGPPAAGRDLFWTGNAGDADANNPTNWAGDLIGTPVTWGPYDDDNWNIGDADAVAASNTVVNYNNTANTKNQGYFGIGDGAEGTLNINSGDLSFATTSSSIQNIGSKNAAGNGTVNIYSGTTEFNTLRIANSGASGAVNVYGGTFTVGRATDFGGYSTSLLVSQAISGTSTGIVHIAGGRMFTRTGVSLGALGDHAVFSVEGSTITAIGIGSNSGLDGVWVQGANAVLKIRVDEGGVTPITVVNKDAGVGGNDGNVVFNTGSTLDIGWMAGVTNYNSFDVMTWDGELVESNLTFAASVDTDIWSFAFLDANEDGTNDTLRAEAYGETAKGTPYGWLNSYGLTVDDDEVDTDTDGLLTWEEYIAGTIPNDSNSVLVVNSLTSSDGVNAVISWQSVAGKSYSIIANPDLVNGTPTVVGSDIIGLETETSVTSSIPAASSLFYQIGVE